MFTGIVDVGKVVDLRPEGGLARIAVALPAALTGLVVGDSIAVNGACLTVIEVGDRRFQAEISVETLRRTSLGRLRPGEAVNLECALRLGDRMGGHLVTGHVDGRGQVTEMSKTAGSLAMWVNVSPDLASDLVERGSVAIDGVSLTISALERERFGVTIIPYTAQRTTLAMKQIGDIVNIELDIIGKYVKRFAGDPKGIDREFLGEHGFI